ncbi:glycoside hydrolase family 25 protein [Streptomyces collinus]|uniref:Glycoside hydrolase n=1 Tax=Streptomyces collinus (strain DSM 40733 / Tue 365) TaxID=1214242 RepID=S5V2V6_STRC3|nr:GH25 family lysozyme [Streptomyces collinus]AGS73933.1 glycoside hydrolase [Streptomyces collinus Tu 365]UJA06127.1 glycoside hydrolase [Streptomyces collinus]
MLTYGLDVSGEQSEDLPGSVAGVSFAFVKATEGHTYVSPVQKAQAASARKAGRTVGFYHFLWPGNISAQAEWFVTQCASVPGDILAVDWETTEAGTYASNKEKDAFLAAVKRLRPNHRIVLYCNTDFWFHHDSTSACGDGLWIADYTSAGRPRIEHPWKFHQYADGPSYDRDVYNGSAAQLHDWARGLL